LECGHHAGDVGGGEAGEFDAPDVGVDVEPADVAVAAFGGGRFVLDRQYVVEPVGEEAGDGEVVGLSTLELAERLSWSSLVASSSWVGAETVRRFMLPTWS
jgi:hypothetical protein